VIITLIGGGPSAADLDAAHIPGLRIGVNDAAFHKPCDLFFTNDHGYALGIRQQIEAFPGERHLNIRHKHQHQFEGWPVTIWRRVEEREPTTDGMRLSSGPGGTPGCSGYVALNLAMRLGAKTIVLFGYDFDSAYHYFFSADPFPRKDIPGVIESFRMVAPWYRKRGIKVLNANPASAIDAFERITHAEAFELYENRRDYIDVQEVSGPKLTAIS
jgi:hypothetical protein